MPDTPIPKEIADEAARWFADRDSGLLESDAALNAWLDADPRHALAFAEMEIVWSDLGAAQVPRGVRASLAAPGTPGIIAPVFSRRWVPMALAASVALMIVGGVGGGVGDWPTRLQADAMTATGEQRAIDLPDGSRIMLNTHSAVAIDYTAGQRAIRLLTGEAAFTVAANPARPFVVEANGGTTTALGTRFIVREDDDMTRVTVTEHRVRVTFPMDRGAAAIVGEGQSITYGGGKGMGAPESGKAADADAWTQGLLTFENRPLAQVVSELGRYHKGYIQVVGARARDRRVSGVFNVNDPAGAVDKLQASLGLRSMRVTDRLIFIYD
ncbi:FecR family protein [Novosphingobium resinovorum]|uniref:FecR family protein n=1 Tax=Novosphingobium resinovorum TaxID=158500 RepID=UPI002ED02E58|nr:FecR family protein [Novosphingobium resinovorum]